MRKKLVNIKRGELKKLSREELINRVANYPDQHSLNFMDDGLRRRLPIGYMAEQIQKNDYQMTDKQYYAILHYFSEITVPNMKVVGVTFYNNDAEEFEKNKISEERNKAVYETDYHLVPEPDNPYDKNAVKVMVTKTDGELHQIGHLSKDFVAAHPITEKMQVLGTIVDYSGGKFANPSYQLALDLEKLDQYKVSLDKAVQVDGRYVYERGFQLNGYVTDIKAANNYLEQSLDLSKDLTDECNSYLQYDPNHSQTDIQAQMYFETGHTGMIRMASGRELSPQELTVTTSYLDYLQKDGRLFTMRMEEFAKIPVNQDTFRINESGFRQVQKPAEPVIPHDGPKQDLELTEDDLKFTEQMNLSQFGIAM